MNSPCVITLSPSEQSTLEQRLRDDDFAFSRPQHTLFNAKKEGVSCTLYASGKCVVQGKNRETFLTTYFPSLFTPAACSASDWNPYIGTDESGKGDFFGPLCVAAVQAPSAELLSFLALEGVRDSKKVNNDKIPLLAERIRQCLPHYVLRFPPQKYNLIYSHFQNLNRFLAWAHATAIHRLAHQTRCFTALTDQFAHPSLLERELAKLDPELSVAQRTHAESDLCVAAASILARDAFLSGIASLEELVGISLPRGSGSAVLARGREILQTRGADVLLSCCKHHFKNLRLMMENA